jgi:Na+/H+ antiporter NhaD/arsenite permease-like protein
VPLIGLAVAGAILLMAPIARPDWSILPGAARGAIFLIALVSAASMMPVKSLPLPSWETAFGLGFVSAVFDNIPLTALAIKQGNYDWGYLAYAVGFGGSMIWFGSSAGVAVAGLMREGRSVTRWLKEGWPVALAYVAGFLLMLALLGWNPRTL